MFTKFAGSGVIKDSGRSVIDGVVTFPGGKFDELKVSGVCTAEGSIEANILNVDGVFTAKGDVCADRLDVDGITTIEGNLRAKFADIDGVTTVNGDKVEADRIVCDGVLTAKNQISADLIEADGFINAREIVGDRIVIKSFRKSTFFSLYLKIKQALKVADFSKIDLIEATTIELRGVRAKVVSGQDIIIGSACIIDRVDCSGKLTIDPDAQVGEVVGSAQVTR